MATPGVERDGQEQKGSVEIPKHLTPVFDVWFAEKNNLHEANNTFSKKLEFLLMNYLALCGYTSKDGPEGIVEPFDQARQLLLEVISTSTQQSYDKEKSNLVTLAAREAVRGNIETTRVSLENVVGGNWRRVKRPTLAMAYFAKAVLSGYTPTSIEDIQDPDNSYMMTYVGSHAVVKSNTFRELHSSFDYLAAGTLLLAQEIANRRYLP
jgi:hypothetical protein